MNLLYPQRGVTGQAGCNFWKPLRIAIASFRKKFVSCLLAVGALGTMSALAQPASVTLAWNAVTGGGVTGYRIYQGTTSHNYQQSFLVGNVTQTSLTNLTLGSQYFFAITAYNAAGVESDYSTEVAYTAIAGRTNSSPLSFAAMAGSITAPFTANSGVVSQATTTMIPTTGGRDVFPFTIAVPGSYVVMATVNAPSGSANSFFVNIDAEPTSPANVWDIPIWSGLTNRPVAWTGSTNAHVFQLGAGQHQLIVVGREANTQLSAVTITPLGTQLQLTMSGGLAVLNGIGQANHIYSVEASSNLKTWTSLGTATADANGSLSYLDTTAPSASNRSYRLKDTTP